MPRAGLLSHDQLRAMYRGGRGNAVARAYSKLWGRFFRLGLLPPRWVTLEVPGRKTGKPMRVPLGMADLDGRWYLVSMLGDCNWTKNVRAARGRATLWRRSRRQVQLVEVPVAQRAPILKRYLEKVPGGRPHFPIGADAPLEQFAAIAQGFPVFEVADR